MGSGSWRGRMCDLGSGGSERMKAFIRFSSRLSSPLPRSHILPLQLPLSNPGLRPAQVAGDVLFSVGRQLHHKLLLVALLGLLQDCLEDLTLDVVFQLLSTIASSGEAVVKLCVVASEHHHQVKPPLREYISDMVLHQ